MQFNFKSIHIQYLCELIFLDISILANTRNDRKISLKYIFILRLKQLFIIIYVNVCVKRVYQLGI